MVSTETFCLVLLIISFATDGHSSQERVYVRDKEIPIRSDPVCYSLQASDHKNQLTTKAFESRYINMIRYP